MTQYDSLNVNLSNSQLHKSNSAMKNETDIILKLPSNLIGNFHEQTNFPHKLLLTNRQDPSLCKSFANNSSIKIKLSYQKPCYLKYCNQEDFLVEFLLYY